MGYLGNTYTLKDVTAQDDEGKGVKLNGQYDVEDYQPYEPAAGILTSYFTLFPSGSEDEALAVTVDPYDLERAIDPEGVAKREAQEARWEKEAAEYMVVDGG